jgi:hypothetical protein
MATTQKQFYSPLFQLISQGLPKQTLGVVDLVDVFS